MQIQFLRHATMVIRISGLSLLVDPMLSPAEAMDPVANAGDDRRIPLVDLPLEQAALESLLHSLDAVLVTHTHRDHWDARAVELLPKALPVICQPADVKKFIAAGFLTVLPVETQIGWNDLTFSRTAGQHGSGEVGQRMAPVSGFVIQAPGNPTVYIAGDTIWCPEVDRALEQYWPDVTILNTGAAQFLTGGPITMTAQDVVQVCRAQPGTRVVAVHLEALNHCQLSRAELRGELKAAGLLERVLIPADGERLDFMSDTPPSDKVNPLRVLVDLQHSPDTQRQEVEGSGLQPRMALLRAWQSERLKHTYADFLADEHSAAACQFFLSDIYAPQDFSQRDYDLEKLQELLSRFIPAPLLSLLTDAIELNHLSNRLDTRLLEAMDNELGMIDEITPALYTAGYRVCDNYTERVHQIDLMTRILQEVGDGAGKPLVTVTLKAARLPAQRYGWQELYDFLARGHAAFRRLGRKNELASTIRQREMQILDRIFAEEEEPFI